MLTNKLVIEMFKTIDLLNRVKAAYSLPSDYALAKKIGISKQAVSRYMKNGAVMDDKVAFTVSELLNLNPAQVVACMHVERAQNAHDEKLVNFWVRFAA